MNIKISNLWSFQNSLKIQKRVIAALFMREIITRYGRHNIGFMWLFIEPMIFTLGIAALWTATKAVHGSNLPIIPFAVIGYSSILLWRNAASRCGKAVESNMALLFHRNVRVIDLFASRLILEIAGATMSFVTLSMIFMFIGLMDIPRDIFTLVLAWFLTAWFAVSLGLIVGAITELSEMFERIWHTITYLTFPLSGAAFMVDWLPKSAQHIVLWLPMVHGTEMLRHGYYGSTVRTYENPTYFITVNLVMLFLGLYMVREVAKRVEPE